MKTNLYKLSLLLVVAAMLVFNGCKKDLVTPASKIPTTAPIAQAVANGKMVLFPGRGWVPASQVHIIDHNSYLMKQNGHIYRMEKVSNKMLEDYGEYKKPVLNSQNIPATTLPVNQGSRSLIPSSQKPAPMASGTNPAWVDYTNWQNTQSSPINYFSTSWTVPAAPDSIANQSIFIFNGLQDTNSDGDVIQPVLGWGPSAGIITGNYWYLTNTYSTALPTPYYFTTQPDSIGPGQLVTGVIKYTGLHNPDDSYNYTSSFSGYTNNVLTLVEGTDFSTQPAPHKGYAPYIPELNLACETLEAYASGSANPPQSWKLYPFHDSVAMKNISLQVNSAYPTLSWTAAASPDTIAGEKAKIISDNNPGGEVDLYFHGLPPPVIKYNPQNFFIVGQQQTLNPTNSGGAPTSYSISPALPAGLSLNTASGVISGPATATSPATNYTVTATNASGSSRFTLTITVSVPISFQVSTTNQSTPTYFMVVVNGVNESGPREVSYTNPINVAGEGNSTSQTVVIQVTSGYMPVSAKLYGPYFNATGVISGNNITFSNFNLTIANYAYQLDFN